MTRVPRRRRGHAEPVPNRLAAATSPYLLQHAENPVDWYEWGEEAFARARERDVPVLLSVGYAACHWCHVMAHESFEDADTAALMNDSFVNVKVDREERPDVDAVYMEAVTATTGHGGWPMTVFLAPSGEPFFAGTYFPPRDGRGQPAFSRVLLAVSRAWQERREEVLAQGQSLVAALAARTVVPDPGGEEAGWEPDVTTPDAALRGLVAAFDERHGGFGGAPKFPPSMVCEALLRTAARIGERAPLAMAERTCEAMARGGLYDQLAGGFARYSVDAAWVVPHFEKMLYDNALLLRVYAHLWRQTGSPLAQRVVRETAGFLLRDLVTPQGGFASALDADTDGVEGLTYVWTPEQLAEVLGDDDGAYAAQLLGVTAEGTFEHGSSTLQLLVDPVDADRWERVRSRLAEARARRPQPARDDKVVAAWNGLTVAALAEAGALAGEPAWVAAASRAAALLCDVHLVDGRLRRTSRDGVVGTTAGVLEDHGDVAEGLLVLHAVTGEPRWLEVATALLDTVLERFGDGSGGFWDTADDAEALVTRPRDPADGAVPSGASAVAGALLAAGAMTGAPRFSEASRAALLRVRPLLEQQPRFAGQWLAVWEAYLAGPLEVAVVDRPDLERVARWGTSPGAVVVTSGPLTVGRPAGAAYVCRASVCDAPTADAEVLAQQVGARPEVLVVAPQAKTVDA